MEDSSQSARVSNGASQVEKRGWCLSLQCRYFAVQTRLECEIHREFLAHYSVVLGTVVLVLCRLVLLRFPLLVHQEILVPGDFREILEALSLTQSVEVAAKIAAVGKGLRFGRLLPLAHYCSASKSAHEVLSAEFFPAGRGSVSFLVLPADLRFALFRTVSGSACCRFVDL